jgi:DnaJ-class molecular chaperone
MTEWIDCPTCQGKGEILGLDRQLRPHRETCEMCKGRKKVPLSPLTKKAPSGRNGA